MSGNKNITECHKNAGENGNKTKNPDSKNLDMDNCCALDVNAEDSHEESRCSIKPNNEISATERNKKLREMEERNKASAEIKSNSSGKSSGSSKK